MINPVRRTAACALAGIVLGFGALAGWPSAQQPGHPTLTVPDGFEVVRVAGPPLVERPIVADFDQDGRLYVAESSGSNAKVEQQLAERPHRVLRLEDVDGDGVFDRRTVFADRLMLPEGTMWFDGSLYVAAPPSIWKLTDTDADGVADVRQEWFQGKTLTGCANDLHGPYLGPDGWIYWTKGAFAEQTYDRPGQPPLVTKAAHVFRRRPGETAIETVLTGGMDNPVDVAFTTTGDRLLTATFLEHPQLGKRDALIHAVYGGVYGKPHGVIDGHPRTGDLLGPVCHLGPSAPSGLTHATGTGFIQPGRGDLLRRALQHAEGDAPRPGAERLDLHQQGHRLPRRRLARLPPDGRHRGRRRQPARRRHGRLVQAVLSDVAAGEAGRAGSDLPRAEARRASGGRRARTSSRLAGGVAGGVDGPPRRPAARRVAPHHRGAGPPRSGPRAAGADGRNRRRSVRRRASARCRPRCACP